MWLYVVAAHLGSLFCGGIWLPVCFLQVPVWEKHANWFWQAAVLDHIALFWKVVSNGAGSLEAQSG